LRRIPDLNEEKAAQEFESWNFPDVPLAIECSAVALEEIRSQAWEGLRKLVRRGLEIGGVLYGTRRRETIRIEAVRPIACQHAQGPGFVLSQADRAALGEQIEGSKKDPELKNLILLGWFVSHTRGGTELTAPDVELYSTYFPEPWQVTLAVHPRHGATSGAFFVRRDGGQEKLEFEFPDRSGLGARRAETRRRPEPAPREPAPLEPAPLEPAPKPAPRSTDSAHDAARHGVDLGTLVRAVSRAERFTAEPASRKTGPARRRLVWVWLTALVLALGGLGWAAVRLVQWNLAVQPLALNLLDKDGQLRIEWNRNARPVMKAVRGWLYIADGQDSSTVDLKPQDLGRGSLDYERKSGSVEVRLRVENVLGHIEEEASRFLGAAPLKRPDPEELKLLEQQRRDLEAEVARLRAEKAVQARRIAELEAAERALRARVRR
jgi:proteasome lid subunit RPN8/RPN11